MQVELPNLNPLHVLVYNQKEFEDKLNEMDANELLDLCPRYKLPNQTLLYHFSDTLDKNFKYFGSKKRLILDYTGLKEFHFDFYEYRQANYIHLVYNDEEINILDLSFISVEMGFDIGVYLDNHTLNQYCKKHQLNGFIKLKESADYHIECYRFENKNFCPVLYLRQFEHIKMLGEIDTIKKEKHLTESHVLNLINVLFCNIVQLLFETDKPVILELTNQLYGKTIESNYTLDIYQGMYYNLLVLSFITPSTPCHEYIEEELEYDVVETVKNIHYAQESFYGMDETLLQYYLSDPIYRHVLSLLAPNINLQPFSYSHYDLITKIPGYEGYTLDVILKHGARAVIQYLERDIIKNLYQYYKKSEKGHDITLNTVNVDYIPSTFNFIIEKVFDRLTDKNLVPILELKVIDKQIKRLFNADDLYHLIVPKKYTKAKLLYNDLVNDIINYKRSDLDLPTITYEYIKWLHQFTENKHLLDFLNQMSQYIYDLYKGFIREDSGILLTTLVEYLNIENIILFIDGLAKELKISKSLLYHFYDFVQEKEFKYFLNEDPVPNLFDNLKIALLTSVFKKELKKVYDVKDKEFFEGMIDKLISQPESQTLLNDETFDWYNFYNKHTIDIDYIDQLLNKLYPNDVMLNIIYNHYNTPLTTKRLTSLLPLMNQNLFQIYAKSELSDEKLRLLVHIDEEPEEEEKKEKTSKKKKSKRKDSKSSSGTESI